MSGSVVEVRYLEAFYFFSIFVYHCNGHGIPGNIESRKTVASYLACLGISNFYLTDYHLLSQFRNDVPKYSSPTIFRLTAFGPTQCRQY